MHDMTAFWCTILAILLLGYFLPTLIAWGRGHPQTGAIFVLNLLLGATFLGWVAALVWAFTTWYRPPPPTWEVEFEPVRQFPFHTPHPRMRNVTPAAAMPLPRRRYYVRS